MKTIKVGDRVIGADQPPYFVADIASNHDGDLQRALKLIELAKESGAHAAKFQNFKASTLVSRRGFASMGSRLGHQASWKKSVYDTYESASLPLDWTVKLKEKCVRTGIEYFTSPYDFESVDFVDPHLECFKIGSGDITWLEILDYIGRKGKPVMLATGASSMEDVDRAVSCLRAVTDDIVLMQCNTNYTAKPENFRFINLKVISAYAARFPDVVLGLSDHTLGHATVLGALALGARVFEKHFTDDRGRPGQDHGFSMDPASWTEMVARADEVYAALGDGVKRVEDNEKETAVVQRRALRLTKPLSKDHLLTADDLFPTRPIQSGGFPPYEKSLLIGRRLTRDTAADELVVEGMLEPTPSKPNDP